MSWISPPARDTSSLCSPRVSPRGFFVRKQPLARGFSHPTTAGQHPLPARGSAPSMAEAPLWPRRARQLRPYPPSSWGKTWRPRCPRGFLRFPHRRPPGGDLSSRTAAGPQGGGRTPSPSSRFPQRPVLTWRRGGRLPPRRTARRRAGVRPSSEAWDARPPQGGGSPGRGRCSPQRRPGGKRERRAPSPPPTPSGGAECEVNVSKKMVNFKVCV